MGDNRNIDGPNGQSITEYLGVEKYEPPEVLIQNAVLKPLPRGTSFYDLENADNFPHEAERLMDIPVFIQEKIEGSNLSVTYVPSTDETFVNQRRHTIVPKENKPNLHWKTARSVDLINFAKYIAEYTQSKDSVVVYGELIGPQFQNNYYKLNKHTIYLFDIKIDSHWQDSSDMLHFAYDYFNTQDCFAPILWNGHTLREFLNEKTIKEASDGQSELINRPREGIVVRPLANQQSDELHGRLILKQRSPHYLSKEK